MSTSNIDPNTPITEKQLEKIFWQMVDIFRASPVDELQSIDIILKLVFIRRMTDLVSPSSKEISREEMSKAWDELSSINIQENSTLIENMLTGALTGAAVGGISTEKDKKLPGIFLGAIGGTLISYMIEEFSHARKNKDSANNIKRIFYKLDELPLFSGIFKYTEIDYESLIFIKSALNILESCRFSLSNISIEKFGKVWSSFIAKYYSNPRLGHGYSVNSKITSMLVSVLNPLPGQKYYDPLNRDQQLFIEAHRKAKINDGEIYLHGQIDNHLTTYAIAKMTLIVNGVLNFDLKYSDDFFSPQHLKLDADVAVSTTIPFGVRFRDIDSGVARDSHVFPETNSLEFKYLFLMLENTNPVGKVALMLPNGLFVSHIGKNIRSYLFKHDLVESIVELPKNSYLNAAVNTSILFLNKKKSSNKKGKILMVNASKYDFNNLDEISELVLNWEEKSDVAKIIGLNDYENKNHSLLPSSYVFENSELLLEMEDETRYKQIKDKDLVLDHKIGRSIKYDLFDEGEMPFIRISDIKESPVKFELELNPVHRLSYDANKLVLVEKTPSILVTLIGDKIKTGIINTPVAIGNDVVAIYPNEKKILKEFFIYQLRSKTTKAQISAMISGTTIPRIRWSDFQNIKIYVPSIETQKAVLAEYKEKQLAEFKAQINIEETEERWFSALIHRLKHDVIKIRNKYEIIDAHLQEKAKHSKPLNLNDPIVEGSADSFEKTADWMRVYIKSSLETIEKTEKAVKGKILPVRFQTKPFLKKVISNYDQTFFKIILGEENFELKADKGMLEIVFSDLIENSVKHGFKEGGNHFIRINTENVEKYKDREDFIKFTYIDDGNGWNSDFDFNKFIEFGETTNSNEGKGIGGWGINKIIEKHSGEFFEIKIDEGLCFVIMVPKNGVLDGK